MYNLQGKKVFVAGHQGMVGSAMVRRLERENCEILTIRRDQLDLRNQQGVDAWFADRKPEVVVLAAAKVGGIFANDSFPAEFLRDNLVLQGNVIDAAYRHDSERLLFLGSSCIYPKHAPQPMQENVLLTGSLEPTNEWYAIAKIAGLKMVQAYRRQYGVDFISAMPTNLYGPGDNFDLQSSHVLPALLRKFHNAKLHCEPVTIWGSGTPRREFLHVDDCADACAFLIANYSEDLWVNIGTGTDVSIRELADLIAQEVEYKAEITYDSSKPDGAPRKLLDVTYLKSLGWSSRIDLPGGIAATYAWFTEHQEEIRGATRGTQH